MADWTFNPLRGFFDEYECPTCLSGTRKANIGSN